MGELIGKRCVTCGVKFETVYPFQKQCYRCGHPVRKPKKKIEKPYRELTAEELRAIRNAIGKED